MSKSQPLLWFFGEFENDLSARMAGGDLFLRFSSFLERECLGNDYSDFLFVDQFANLGELN